MFILALSLCLAAGAQAQPVGASADDESRLPTFAEKPDPTRSDSHAWSAPPNYNFLALVAGIRGHDVTDEQFKEGYARAIERMRADSAFFAESARHLQRTMRRLRASRPDSARSVRVLVYGQSSSATTSATCSGAPRPRNSAGRSSAAPSSIRTSKGPTT